MIDEIMNTGYVIIVSKVRSILLECTLGFGNKKMTSKQRYTYVMSLFLMTENTEIDNSPTTTRGEKIADLATLNILLPLCMVSILITECGATNMCQNRKNFLEKFGTTEKIWKKLAVENSKNFFEVVNLKGKHF